METRRFILALSLSLIVFLVYVRFFAPKPPEKPPCRKPPSRRQSRRRKQESRSVPSVRPGEAAKKIVAAAAGKDIVVETDLVKAVVNTAGGVIKGVELKHYREADKTPVGLGVMFNKIMGKATAGRAAETSARQRAARSDL